MMCDLHDIGVSLGDNATGKSIPPRDIRQRMSDREEMMFTVDEAFEPNLFVYDNFPGGIGLSPSLFALEKQLLEQCLRTIRDCPCQGGCPSCVGPTKSSGQMAKDVALQILQELSSG